MGSCCHGGASQPQEQGAESLVCTFETSGAPPAQVAGRQPSAQVVARPATQPASDIACANEGTLDAGEFARDSAAPDAPARGTAAGRPVAPAPAAPDPADSCCCARHKATPREEEFQADLQRRLNRAIGQLNGVKAMLEDNRYCGDVLTQLAAAESAVHRVSEMILRNHMQTCVVEQIRSGHDEVIDEAMGLIHRFGGR